MITVQEAIKLISQHTKGYGSVSIPITEATGRVLDEDLSADRDYPPFDRVTMDGISINYTAYANGQRTYPIESVAPAGAPFQTLDSNTNCIEVMTGAGTPYGCDTVIRYEDIDINESKQTATLLEGITVKHRQNVHFQGSDHKASNVLISKGTVLRPSDIGICASLGYPMIKVKSTPKTAIISTGDELVDIDQNPLPHQIRKSNVYTIQSRLKHYGIIAKLFHLTDEKAVIRDELTEILKSYDVVILSGGVSKGKFDYIPEILTELDVIKTFYKIKQRPGKPFWFGNTDKNIIFALPGNPVSSFVCTKKYIEHWLTIVLRIHRSTPYAILGSDVHFKPDLHYFLQVKVEYTDQGTIIGHPKKGNGSGDFINLTRTQAFIELPRGQEHFKAGEIFPLLMFDS